ncbi:hypothetical protein CI102_5195 [Trichoderma harzianum]|nr:hypothetical protein CI102_5195 [Trichoderma harzianum]
MNVSEGEQQQQQQHKGIRALADRLTSGQTACSNPCKGGYLGISTYRYLALDTQGISIRVRATNDGSRFGSSNASRKVQVHARVSVRVRMRLCMYEARLMRDFCFFLDSDSLYLQLGGSRPCMRLHGTCMYIVTRRGQPGAQVVEDRMVFCCCFLVKGVVWGAKCYFCTFLYFLHFLVMVRITTLASFAYKVHTLHQPVMKSDR